MTRRTAGRLLIAVAVVFTLIGAGTLFSIVWNMLAPQPHLVVEMPAAARSLYKSTPPLFNGQLPGQTGDCRMSVNAAVLTTGEAAPVITNGRGEVAILLEKLATRVIEPGTYFVETTAPVDDLTSFEFRVEKLPDGTIKHELFGCSSKQDAGMAKDKRLEAQERVRFLLVEIHRQEVP